jgi:ABC-2 type transport system permease protein
MPKLSKYWLLFRTHWQTVFVYNVSFLLWRFRQVLATFSSLIIWRTIYQQQTTAFGYTQDAMVSYIFLTGFLQSFILATQTTGLGQKIYAGDLSNDLVKPVNIFGSLLTQELADKCLNFSFVIVETTALYFLFRPQLVIPSLPILGLFFLSTFLGATLLFLIMLLFGTMGFWTPETWGPRFLFYMFIDFTAGRLFPLNIFPAAFQKVLFFTPFPYLTYVQTQIFLGKMSMTQTAQALGALTIWIAMTYVLFRRVWGHGIKEYGAAGR